MKLQQVINIKWDKDIVMAICIGVFGSLVALSMFFLSGYMITQSALGAPLYALMGLIVTVKLFGFIRAITKYYERLRSHRATFTMLRDVRVQLYRALIPIVPDVFGSFARVIYSAEWSHKWKHCKIYIYVSIIHLL